MRCFHAIPDLFATAVPQSLTFALSVPFFICELILLISGSWFQEWWSKFLSRKAAERWICVKNGQGRAHQRQLLQATRQTEEGGEMMSRLFSPRKLLQSQEGAQSGCQTSQIIRNCITHPNSGHLGPQMGRHCFYYIIKIEMEKQAGQSVPHTSIPLPKKEEILMRCQQGQAMPQGNPFSHILLDKTLRFATESDKELQRKQNSSSQDCGVRGWTVEEERRLVELHNLKGNRWVEIARQLQRSDNSVKNHYHSRLRKALRKMNKCIIDHLHPSSKILKSNLLSKIIQTSEAYYPRTNRHPQPEAHLAYKLKNEIISLAELGQQQATQQQINRVRDLVRDIEVFVELCKKEEKEKKRPRAGNNKYKGKEILSLLEEHQQKRQNQANMEKLRASEEEESILRQEHAQSQEMRHETEHLGNNPAAFSNVQPVYFYNQPMYPFCFPLIHSISGLFSPQYASYPFFPPQNDKTWSSIPHLQPTLKPNLEQQPKPTPQL